MVHEVTRHKRKIRLRPQRSNSFGTVAYAPEATTAESVKPVKSDR